MKGNSVPYLLMYLILRIYINVKNCVQKRKMLAFIFQSSISHSILHLEMTKFLLVWMTCTSRELCLRILIYVLVFVLCQKTGNYSIILCIFFFKIS